jgi:hypothetical protein
MVTLGFVTCPSGEFVVTDGGYLELGSGAAPPDDPEMPAVDFEVVGPDAVAAARSFDHQNGVTLYDIPAHAVAAFTAKFDAHCADTKLDASLHAFDARVPHRERVRRAVAMAAGDFLMTGVTVVAVGGLPTDRELPVVAEPGEYGWSSLRVVVSDRPVAGTREVGPIVVDTARFVLADADALNHWQHHDPIDGRADTVFWGRDDEAAAEALGATRTGTPGDDVYGWTDLPIGDAYDKAVEVEAWKNAAPGRGLAFDFRPHSHHFQVMAGVRASEEEAATIEIGGARLMFAMTTVGDGVFPVHVDVDDDGHPVAIRIDIDVEDEDD